MLTQAKGLKYGIEHYRRNKPQTSGVLFWQLNDCWSVIDYYLLPKASYHYARKFFHPTLLTIDHDRGEDIKIWIVNDRLEINEDALMRASVLQELERLSIGIYPIIWIGEKEVLGGLLPKEDVMILRSKNNRTYENTYCFCDQKDLTLPAATITAEYSKENNELTLSANHLTRMVTIKMDTQQLVMDDNFFDLQRNQVKTVKVSQAEGMEIPWNTLRVNAINSSNIYIRRVNFIRASGLEVHWIAIFCFNGINLVPNFEGEYE